MTELIGLVVLFGIAYLIVSSLKKKVDAREYRIAEKERMEHEERMKILEQMETDREEVDDEE